MKLEDQVCGLCGQSIKGLFRDHTNETCIFNLQQNNVRLKSSLLKFGQHISYDCNISRGIRSKSGRFECTCGFDIALGIEGVSKDDMKRIATEELNK